MIKTKRFNPMDYLENDSEIAEYLHEAFLDDDPQVFIIALGYFVKSHGVAKVATITGLNRESLYKTLSGESKPTWETVHRLLKGVHLDVSFTVTA